MLRSLSIRNFVIIDRLDLEFGSGFSVITGETGAGKSVLLDALDLLLGERFEAGSVRAGAARAELAAEFAIGSRPRLGEWLAANDLAGEPDTLLVRRILEAGGRSRSYVNGHPVTAQQLREAGASLVDIHGQHAHQSLLEPDVQRELLDSFGGFASLTRETRAAAQRWRAARAAREHAAKAAAELGAEQELLAARDRDLEQLAVTESEWQELTLRQRRLANAAGLLAASELGARVLSEDDDAVLGRLAALLSRLRAAAIDDPVLAEAVDLVEPAEIQLAEASRVLRAYRQRADLDPADLVAVEQRLSAIHEAARKYRVRPEELPELARKTVTRLAELERACDDGALARDEQRTREAYDALAGQLTARRRVAASALSQRLTAALQTLAMPLGTLSVELLPLAESGASGAEQVEFRVSAHPQQAPGPLSRVASGGELSRISLAIQVVTSEVASVPTLVFDEVDVGIGGSAAEVVGRLLQQLGGSRQVICVTHLAQVAACADRHYRVSKGDQPGGFAAEVAAIEGADRIEEIARMMGGVEITEATRAHAEELVATSSRPQIGKAGGARSAATTGADGVRRRTQRR